LLNRAIHINDIESRQLMHVLDDWKSFVTYQMIWNYVLLA